MESALVLKDVAAGAKPSALKRRTPEPQLQEIDYDVAGRRSSGDLYVLPDRAAKAGIILVPGVARAGRRDTRIVALARTLARARFAVLVPELRNISELKVSAHDAQGIADASRYLLSRSDLVPEGRIGIAAASYAVGPAVLASLLMLNERIDFILSIGGYYDVKEALTFAITGYYRDRTQPGAKWRYLKPDGYVKLVFLVSTVDRISSSQDRELLKTIAKRKLQNPDAPIDALASRLGKEGRALYDLLTARQPEHIPMLIERLPPAVKQQILQLDLASRDLSSLRAHMILIHGRNDRTIPFTESKALSMAVPSAKLIIVNNLAHVNIEKGSVIDALRLWCAVDELLSQRSKPRGIRRSGVTGS